MIFKNNNMKKKGVSSMVEKEEIETEDDIKEKEKTEAVKASTTEEGNKEVKKDVETETKTEPIIEPVTEPITESEADAIKTDKTEEATQEIELENDPWSEESWRNTFPELYENEKVEDVIQKAEGLGEADVIRIVREQLKLWLKGVSEGKYPLPKGLGPSKEPYPEKSEIDEEFEKSKAILDSYAQKFDDISKTFEELGKEIQLIKDTPVDLMKKSIDEDKNKDYVSPYAFMKDGTITQKK